MPHQHHNDLCTSDIEVKHTKASTIVDYLELVFHIDLGNNHLEQINNSNALDIEIQSNTILIPSGFIKIEHIFCISEELKFIDQVAYSIDNIPINNIFSSTLILRGPPTFS